jgi:hypothetical protein
MRHNRSTRQQWWTIKTLTDVMLLIATSLPKATISSSIHHRPPVAAAVEQP